MKKLHSFALHAFVTPVIALGAGSVLAQQPGQDSDREQQSAHEQESTERDQGAAQSTSRTTQSAQSAERDSQSAERSSRSAQRGNQSAERAGQSDSQAAADDTRGQSGNQNRGYLDSAPANSMQASNLIGARVRTTSDEDVGSVNDLIIDEDGQIVAVVFGAGGFLGLGEKDVAIGWDDVTRSGASDEQESDEQESAEQELRIQVTREDLRSAPGFERQD